MQLQDLENWVLWNTQQSELVNFGSVPNWASANNPQLPQTAVDAAINRAYARVLQDLADLEIATFTSTIASVAQTSDYALPLNSGDPAVQRICRVYYQPVGQSYTQELEPGVRLISWKKFQAQTGAGYLRPFTYGVIPDYVAVSPNRTKLSFYPGSADAGDTITVEYVPYITAGSSVPPLAAPTDTPILPDSCDDSIQFLATAYCWPKLAPRDGAVMQQWLSMYEMEKKRLREDLAQRSRGDTQQITDRALELYYSNPQGLPLIT